jgi:DNA-3-methyladenine glycosylase II
VTDGRHGSAQQEAIEHLRRSDPILRRVIDAHPHFKPRAWLSQLPPLDAFGTLLFQIAGQQLSFASSRHILRQMATLFGGRLPSPEEALSASPASLRRTGLSRRKVATLRDVALRFRKGSLSDAKLRRLSDREVEEILTAIPGIGPWTAHGFLIIALERPDVVLPGDLALRRAIQRLYGLGRMPNEKSVLKIARPWRPFRSLASAYVFQAAFDRPQSSARTEQAATGPS